MREKVCSKIITLSAVLGATLHPCLNRWECTQYGLDTSDFSYDPSRAANSQDPQLPAPASTAAQGRQCIVM